MLYAKLTAANAAPKYIAIHSARPNLRLYLKYYFLINQKLSSKYRYTVLKTHIGIITASTSLHRVYKNKSTAQMSAPISVNKTVIQKPCDVSPRVL